MTADPRGDRLQIMLTADELRLLDDWRFANRMPSRSAAVRELLKRGLAVEGLRIEGDVQQKSKDFGVGPARAGQDGVDGHSAPGALSNKNGNDSHSR